MIALHRELPLPPANVPTPNQGPVGPGALIVNADDWGRDRRTTGMILECILPGAVSSTSAMVFMEDSDRASEIAQKHRIDVGLHVNLTAPFTSPLTPGPLMEHQGRLRGYLRRHRLAQVIFHPGLTRSFEYVVRTQFDEFRRLYDRGPDRIDGHHHMHLCANVMIQGLLPAGTLIRRNFSFQRGEKGIGNRMYRRVVDALLGRRHRLVDFLFNLLPLEPRGRLDRIFDLSRHKFVELETHPVNPMEYQFLAGGEIFRRIGDLRIVPFTAVGQLKPRG